MATMTLGIALLSMVLASTGANPMFCGYNPTNIPWIPAAGIMVGAPWNSYPAPENGCCNVPTQTVPFDVQGKCSLCYDHEHDLPGYAADPNNCAQFYSCVLRNGVWIAYLMPCPDCTFWDQDKLMCVQVDDSCLTSVSVATDPGVTAQDEENLMFCIDFEDADLVGQGVYQPWVGNNDVTVVTNAGFCPEGSRCGYFNESSLSVPFFSNAYASFPSLKITFWYNRTPGSTDLQGLISNDCFNYASDDTGNSLYASCEEDMVEWGLKNKDFPLPGSSGSITAVSVENSWVYVEMAWDEELDSFTVTTQNPGGSYGPQQFTGRLRNSHCALVIGTFIHKTASSYFHGYMDNICFYKK